MIRPGGPADADTMLAFLDEAVAWMVERGQSEQWGSEPWSAQPKRVARVRAMAESGLLWIAEADGAPAGALVLGEPPEMIPPVDEPEVYIRFLITSRRLAGRGIGSDLLDFARARTRALGIGLLRVDCWAGARGRLVDYYVRNGFTPSATFTVDDWPGQVLEQRVD
ncbi:GNAT family N-acetyltransferase [Actinokineospora xionganensis]|uniref:GNAT family N-acetyltransferase n=1 Tax=Actinokineospora xionganensis TaxID=2684470 RepID=A0ABR7LG36_9PSEU|nr:GNAT family N-acetyltransferase [Actinokineospora xionganensis]MBC6451448.1 GNAT family N-acetyltransferase [Actinokineospora xionganensis]